MAVVRENVTIDGREFVRNYSDSGFYVERDEGLYVEAIDPIEYAEERTYRETDVPIIPEEPEPEPGKEDYYRLGRILMGVSE